MLLPVGGCRSSPYSDEITHLSPDAATEVDRKNGA